MSKTYSLTIKVSETTLTDHLIDNLASEFYGIIGAHAGPGHPNEMTVEFRDYQREDGEAIDGAECRTGFEKAMLPYHLEPGD